MDEVLILDADPGFVQLESGLFVPHQRKPRRLRGIDLFCGCGGFSLGVISAGVEVVGAAEWWAEAAMTYLYNLGTYPCDLQFVEPADRDRLETAIQKSWKRNRKSKILEPWLCGQNRHVDPGVSHFWFGDVAKLTGARILADLGMSRGELDIVFGGPPCQGMSQAVKQREDDPRNNLVLEHLRIAAELGAKTCVMENVPPLVTSTKFRPLLDEWIRRANEAGYDVVANILDAANFGVPQFRRRAFIVASLPGFHFQFPTPTNWAIGSAANGQRWDTLEKPDIEPSADDEELFHPKRKGERTRRRKAKKPRQQTLFEEGAA